MKRIIILTLITVTTLQMPAWSITKDDVLQLIKGIQDELADIQSNPDKKQFVPFDIYNDIVLNIISSSIKLKEKQYEKAYWYGQISSIKLETLKILAEAKKLELQAITDQSKAKTETTEDVMTLDNVPLSQMMKANLQRKGSTFRIELLDKDLFYAETFKLTVKGKEQLNSIIDAISAYTNSRVSIIGHTRWEDYKKFSKWKARVIFNYIAENGIDPGRIEYLGVGNRVVMITPWGYKRISRVEIILYGIELQ